MPSYYVIPFHLSKIREVFYVTYSVYQILCACQLIITFSVKDSIENLRGCILKELDYSDELGKNVIDSFIDKIVVYKGSAENEIELKSKQIN